MDALEVPVTIDLDRVFSEINTERKAAELPQIEHAIMRVRLNIRLAIKRIERLPDEGPVTLDRSVLQDLADGLNELFQTSYSGDRLAEFECGEQEAAPAEEPSAPQQATEQPPPSAPPIAEAPEDESAPPARIYLVDFFSTINEERRNRRLPPIEPAVISVRTGVRFSILRRRRLDFGQSHIDLSPADLEAMTRILAEQFDIVLANGLQGLVAEGRKRQQDEPRKMSWLERIFRKRSFKISVPAMIMAVTRQRARLGYRPLSPAKINEGCGGRLSAMGIHLSPNDSYVTLDEQQMDRLAEFLREEYGLYFEDLESFIESGN